MEGQSISWSVQECRTRCCVLTCNVLRKVLSLHVPSVDAVWQEAINLLTSRLDGMVAAE